MSRRPKPTLGWSEEDGGYRELVESANTIVLRWDLEGRVLYLNEYGLELFGYRAEELVGRSVIGTIVPETESSGRDLVHMINDLLRHPERFVDNENENIRRNGERVWITWRNRTRADRDGVVRELLSIGIDTTRKRQAEEALRHSERRYRALFESTPIALVERDASALKAHLDGLRTAGVEDFDRYFLDHPEDLVGCLGLVQVTDLNAVAAELFETRTPHDLDGYAHIRDPAAFVRIARAVVADLAGDAVRSSQREGVIRTLGGRERQVLVRTTVVPGHGRDPSRIVTALIDITEVKEAEAALRASESRYRELSVQDNLTGLYNTRYLYSKLGELLTDAAPPCSVVFLDLDHFKSLVDTHGHLNGSRAIQEVAHVIESCLVAPAFAVAYAGDEFVVVAEGCGKSQALALAATIRDRIAATVFLEAEGRAVRITASLGVATFPHDAGDLQGLLAAADQALFAAKARGRNSIAAFPA